MRIALVNDMMAAVEALRRVILGTREHEVAWVTRDGAEALILSLDKIGRRLTNIAA